MGESPAPEGRMHRFARVVLLPTVIALIGAGASSASAAVQTPPVVQGVVVDSTGRPIAYAQVRGPGVDPRISDDSGRFRFTMRKAGPLTLEVRRVGFTPLEAKFTVSADTSLSLVMHPLAAS